jgi:hypothetical protein
MGKRDRERKERIRAGLEAPISPSICEELGWEQTEDWDDDDTDFPPTSYVRRCLDEEGFPYEIIPESCPVHLDQWGEAIRLGDTDTELHEEFLMRITKKWIAEGRPNENFS